MAESDQANPRRANPRRANPRRALTHGKELAEVTLAAIGEGVIRTDADGHIDYMNPAAEALTGWPLAEAAGRRLGDVYQVVSEATRRPRRNPVEICLAERRTVVPPGLFTLKSRGGEEYTVRDSIAPIFSGVRPEPPGSAPRRALGAVVVFRDLTRVRGLERQMAYLASHDALTGLLNRQEFEIYLEAALESARDQGLRHVLLFLDLWEFKLINDCYGLVAGDELLRQAAEILRSRFGEGVLGRVGGDEFVLLLESATPEEAHEVARGLRRQFRDFRFAWGGQRFEIGLSIGLVPVTAASESVDQLLKASEAACYLAQRGGRNNIHAYASDDSAVAERHGRLHRVRRLRRSLAEDRFCLYRQEIRPLRRDGAAFYEILVRMVDDDGSHILPGDFIPIAEEHDLATSLDRWVVRQVLERLAGGELAGAAVSINLSGHSLGDESFLDDLAGVLQASPVAAERLCFEVTETAAVAHLSRAREVMSALKSLGCRFILDDFGRGVSSFAYLKSLPVDLLKIDGEFVRSMADDRVHRAMVAAINQIGQVMGLETIAEWVESEAVWELLRELGVDYAQGFWLHRPAELG